MSGFQRHGRNFGKKKGLGSGMLQDGKYFLVEGAFSLLREKFGRERAARDYKALKSLGVLIPKDPKARGRNKTFLLKDIPEITSRAPEKEEAVPTPELEAVLSRLDKVEATISELSTLLSRDNLKELFKKLAEETNLNTQLIDRVREYFEPKLIDLEADVGKAIHFLQETTDSLKQEAQTYREELSQIRDKIEQKEEIFRLRGVQALSRFLTNLLTTCLEDLKLYVSVAKILLEHLPEREKRKLEEILEQIPQEN